MGSSSVTGLQTFLFADNISFDGTPRGAGMTTDGQLFIGSTASPHIRVGTLTAGSGVSITNSSGSISISATGSGGTVTSVSVVSANGFAGTVATATTTPAITLTTSVTGVLSGNGTAISGSAVTQHAVLIGGASNAVSSTSVGSTGQVLQANSAADPTYSTATYPSIATGTGTILRADGTNWVATTATYPATTTINQLLYSSANNVIGGVTASIDGVLISSHANGTPSWLANGTAGYVLTAQSGAPPAWAAASGGVTTISGDSGSVTGSTVSIKSGGVTTNVSAGAGYSVKFTGSGTAMTYTNTDNNSNMILGSGAGPASNKSFQNNVIMGFQAFTAAGNSASQNCAYGYNALNSSVSGTYNASYGYNSGIGLTTSDSNNIDINAPGVAGDNNVLRIGSGTGSGTQQLAKAFISGINSITVTGTAVLVSSSDQLGVAVSSRKYKDNITDMGEYSSDILKLRPVTFTLKGHSDQTIQSGLIAEEVDEVFPDIMVYDKNGDPQTVQYHNLPALLLNELQKALKRIEALEAKLVL